MTITQFVFIPRTRHSQQQSNPPKTSQTPLPLAILSYSKSPIPAPTAPLHHPTPPLVPEPSRCFSPAGSPARSPAPPPSSGAGPSGRSPPLPRLQRPAHRPAALCPPPPLGGSTRPGPLRRRRLTPAPRRSRITPLPCAFLPLSPSPSAS